jgi:hypothetical protein
MSFVLTTPEMLAAAAGDLQGIGSAIDAANMAAAAPTTGVLPSAADPVSVRTAALFAALAHRYQALSARAAAFHQQFVQNLVAGGNSYAETEASNVAATRLTPVLASQHTANSLGPAGHISSGNPGTGILGKGNIGNANLGSGNITNPNFGSGNIGDQVFARANFGGQNLGTGNNAGQTFGGGNVGSQNIGTGKSGYGIPGNNNSGLGHPDTASAMSNLNSTGTGNGTGTQSANPAALASHAHSSNSAAGNLSPANTGNANTSTATSTSPTDIALIMGGTGNPQPSPSYVNAVYQTYIAPYYPGYTPVGLYTPEQFWPVTGLTSETFGQSVRQGVALLNNAIMTKIAAGDHVIVFGYSQSATIATIEMRHLDALPASVRPSTSMLKFVLLGDPNSPNGGILERFHGLYIPGLNVHFDGATPPNTPYHTVIYSIQYDPIADFPQYPIDLPADLNALLGYFYLHGTYPNLTAAQLATAIQEHFGATTYYLIPTQNLPLLDPLRQLGVPSPIIDLIQPFLRAIIDLGYGNGPAYVPTPAQLFPHISLSSVAGDLSLGAAQGVLDPLAAGLPPLAASRTA